MPISAQSGVSRRRTSPLRTKANIVTFTSPQSHYAPQLARVEWSAANEFKSQANLAKLGCLCAKRFCNALWSTGFCKTGAFCIFAGQCLWSVSGNERKRNVLGTKNVGNGIDGFAAQIYVEQGSVNFTFARCCHCFS